MIRKGAWTAAVIVPALIAANFLPRICVYLFAGAALLLFIVLLFLRKRLAKGRELLLLAGALALASAVFCLKYEVTYAPLRPLVGREVSAQVRFTEIDGDCFIAEVIDARCEGESVRIPGKLRLRLFRVDAEEWDTANVSLRMTVDEATSNALDRADGFYAQAEVLEISDVATPESVPLAARFSQFRADVGALLRLRVGGDEGGLACAVLTGDKQYLDDELKVDFSRCGLSHIMAVSGLHLSVLCALIFAVGKTGVPRRISVIIAVAVIGIVCVLAGFSMSVLRAGIMSLITFSGLLFRRRGDSLNSLGIALSLLGLCSPFSVLDAAYPLSGAATLGIIAVSPVLEAKFCRRLVPGGLGEKIVRSACTTCAATLCTLPIAVIYFGEISLVGIPAMLLATWPVTAALVLAALLCLFSWIPLFGEFIAFLLKLCCELLIRIASFLSDVSFAVIDIRWEPLLVWLGICAAAAIVWIVFRRRPKVVKLLPPLICAALIACVTIGAVADSNKTELYIAEEGFSVLSCGRDTVVVDCASPYAAETAADKLHEDGIYSVGALIITSTDLRACGGACAFMRRVGVKTLYIPASGRGTESYRAISEAASASSTRVVPVSENITQACGNISLSLLPLPGETCALAAAVSAENARVLYTSTGGEDVCRQLCLYCRDYIDADILVTGACTQEKDIYRVLISDVSPEITAVISFSRPDGKISEAERMRVIGSCSALYQTGVDGDIFISVDASGKIQCRNR